MDEKKKLLIGMLGAMIVSAGISYLMLPSQSKKSDFSAFYGGGSKSSSSIFGSEEESKITPKVLERFDDGNEKKVMPIYVPLDIEAIKKEVTSGTENAVKEKQSIPVTIVKTEDVKDENDNIIAKKEILSDNTIKISYYTEPNNTDSIFYTETTREENGKYQGKSKSVYEDGTVQIYTYENGVKVGEAEIEYTNGDKEVYTYKDGNATGAGTYYFANGDREEFIYENGVMNGPARYIFANGKEEKYNYKNGNRE